MQNNLCIHEMQKLNEFFVLFQVVVDFFLLTTYNQNATLVWIHYNERFDLIARFVFKVKFISNLKAQCVWNRKILNTIKENFNM
jgi:hypothetical protein